MLLQWQNGNFVLRYHHHKNRLQDAVRLPVAEVAVQDVPVRKSFVGQINGYMTSQSNPARTGT